LYSLHTYIPWMIFVNFLSLINFINRVITFN
jgi:hypothetical protein